MREDVVTDPVELAAMGGRDHTSDVLMALLAPPPPITGWRRLRYILKECGLLVFEWFLKGCGLGLAYLLMRGLAG